MIGAAENTAGLRARARAGDRGALIELHGRAAAEAEGLRGNRALQVAMLNRLPTPLQASQEARAERADARTAARQGAEDTEKGNTDFFDRYYGGDKEKAADFYQNLNATLPLLRQGKGASFKNLTDTERSAMLLLNEVRNNIKPGKFNPFGNAPSRNLLDVIPTGQPVEGFFRTMVKTPDGNRTIGEMTEGNKALRDFLTKLITKQPDAGLRR